MATLQHIALVLLVSVLGGCAFRGPQRPAVPQEVLAWEQQVHDLVNAYRTGGGLPRLRHHAGLAAIARQHSQAMASGEAAFSHSGLEERARRAGRHLALVDLGENLLATQAPSSLATWRAVGGWLESPTHRQVIEGCYTLSGVGVAVDSRGMIFITHLFALEAVVRVPPPPCVTR